MIKGIAFALIVAAVACTNAAAQSSRHQSWNDLLKPYEAKTKPDATPLTRLKDHPWKFAIEIGQGTQIVLQAEEPFSTVAVGDAEIADVIVRFDGTLVIAGKKIGSSDVIIVNNASSVAHWVTINVSATP